MQTFELKFSGVTILQGVEFPVFLLIISWALQQCNATALPVMHSTKRNYQLQCVLSVLSDSQGQQTVKIYKVSYDMQSTKPHGTEAVALFQCANISFTCPECIIGGT